MNVHFHNTICRDLIDRSAADNGIMSTANAGSGTSPPTHAPSMFTLIGKKARANKANQPAGKKVTNDEWATPVLFVEMSRKVMGRIDLDPASDADFNKQIKATNFFDIEHDGLKQEWIGRVFLNPPYSNGLIGKFAAKLIEEWNSGRMTEAVMVVHNCTETRWFQSVMRAATATCFPSKRIRFDAPNGSPGPLPLRGQTFFYFGKNVDKFTDVFGGKFGTVMVTATGQVKTTQPKEGHANA
jgi:hypothetical protein